MNSKYLCLSIGLHFFAVFFISTKIVNRTIEFKFKNIEIQVATNEASKNTTFKKKISKATKLSTNKKLAQQQILFPNLHDMIVKKVDEDSRLDSIKKTSSIDERLLPEILTQYRGINAQDIRFTTSLWKQIDQSIVESSYLSEYGHVGRVALTFEISSEGKIVEQHFKAQAEDPILKVVAARAIRFAIKNENNELEFPKKMVRFQANFAWTNLSECDRLRGIHQNTLSFCKYGEDKRKTFSTSEKVTTYLGALMYGPGVVEEIKNYNRQQDHKNIKFDPFESFRRDPDFNLGS